MKLHPRLAGAALLLLLAAGAALAQPVYRHVDKNGRVTFSDQPPAANAPAVAPRGSGEGGAGPALPYELRQVAQRYPVTIYTSDECGPCGAGRSLLVTRGVPFEERTVKSSEDIEALQRLSGQNSLPLLTIGSQQLKGFSDAQWSQYLDAAGYPKSSQVPAGYRNPPAQPLVASQAAPAAPAPAAAAPAPAPVPPPAAASGPTPSNPAGIKF
ncbi:glutaredoxin-like protein, YruB-family [Variovorax sp. PBS-H4]|uniref:glutaredoxin family protein n=1 Tax=Variovorax sp. PBS-H4 TaxID=434008 RepID=UPI001318B0B4|nr:glutaredoxin family protein [Variovorax sp. PBS-H4]VTU37051.1 glutaredoxin-like protein, YruB-family [Variovorax sp. PBS-H4]